jgi:16S rRNA (cytosine1402-N4)-methyltransferase
MSSDQLADDARGFSFHASGPLDLRFDPTRGEPAWRVLQRLSERHLADLIFRYGEERFSRRIARRIVQQRRRQPIRSSRELAELVRGCIPSSAGRPRLDPATRTFQALRIMVNDELNSLETALRDLPECLQEGGRLAVISFHSLEDRLVKSAFRQDDRYEMISRDLVRPGTEELRTNPRSRSARMRVARRTAR